MIFPQLREYAEAPRGMHVFNITLCVVRYGGNVCGLAMNPGMMVLENNIERVPGAALLSITMTHFGHHDGHDGFLIGGTARFASWWRKFAPAQYQRREYGGPGGWPAEVLQFPRKYPWLGFRPPIFRGLHEG